MLLHVLLSAHLLLGVHQTNAQHQPPQYNGYNAIPRQNVYNYYGQSEVSNPYYSQPAQPPPFQYPNGGYPSVPVSVKRPTYLQQTALLRDEPPQQPQRIINNVIRIEVAEKAEQAPSQSTTHVAMPKAGMRRITVTKDFDVSRMSFVNARQPISQGATLMKVKTVVAANASTLENMEREQFVHQLSQELDQTIPMVLAKIDAMKRKDDPLQHQVEKVITESLASNINSNQLDKALNQEVEKAIGNNVGEKKTAKEDADAAIRKALEKEVEKGVSENADTDEIAKELEKAIEEAELERLAQTTPPLPPPPMNHTLSIAKVLEGLTESPDLGSNAPTTVSPEPETTTVEEIQVPGSSVITEQETTEEISPPKTTTEETVDYSMQPDMTTVPAEVDYHDEEERLNKALVTGKPISATVIVSDGTESTSTTALPPTSTTVVAFVTEDGTVVATNAEASPEVEETTVSATAVTEETSSAAQTISDANSFVTELDTATPVRESTTVTPVVTEAPIEAPATTDMPTTTVKTVEESNDERTLWPKTTVVDGEGDEEKEETEVPLPKSVTRVEPTSHTKKITSVGGEAKTTVGVKVTESSTATPETEINVSVTAEIAKMEETTVAPEETAETTVSAVSALATEEPTTVSATEETENPAISSTATEEGEAETTENPEVEEITHEEEVTSGDLVPMGATETSERTESSVEATAVTEKVTVASTEEPFVESTTSQAAESTSTPETTVPRGLATEESIRGTVEEETSESPLPTTLIPIEVTAAETESSISENTEESTVATGTVEGPSAVETTAEPRETTSTAEIKETASTAPTEGETEESVTETNTIATESATPSSEASEETTVTPEIPEIESSTVSVDETTERSSTVTSEAPELESSTALTEENTAGEGSSVAQTEESEETSATVIPETSTAETQMPELFTKVTKDESTSEAPESKIPFDASAFEHSTEPTSVTEESETTVTQETTKFKPTTEPLEEVVPSRAVEAKSNEEEMTTARPTAETPEVVVPSKAVDYESAEETKPTAEPPEMVVPTKAIEYTSAEETEIMDHETTKALTKTSTAKTTIAFNEDETESTTTTTTTTQAPTTTTTARLITTKPLVQQGSSCPVANDVTDPNRADVLFLVDSSTSVPHAQFQRALKLIGDTVQQFRNIGPDGTQVSLVQYNREPFLEFSLRRHNCISSLLDDIADTPYMNGVSNLGNAIDKVMNHGFSKRRGDRPDAANVLVLVSDGASDDNVKVPMKLIERENTTVLVISTVEAHPDVLRELAGSDLDKMFHLGEALQKPLHIRLAEKIREVSGIALITTTQSPEATPAQVTVAAITSEQPLEANPYDDLTETQKGGEEEEQSVKPESASTTVTTEETTGKPSEEPESAEIAKTEKQPEAQPEASEQSETEAPAAKATTESVSAAASEEPIVPESTEPSGDSETPETAETGFPEQSTEPTVTHSEAESEVPTPESSSATYEPESESTVPSESSTNPSESTQPESEPSKGPETPTSLPEQTKLMSSSAQPARHSTVVPTSSVLQPENAEIQVTCLPSGFKVNFALPGAFGGAVVVRGHATDDNCRKNVEKDAGQAMRNVEFELFDEKCGLKKTDSIEPAGTNYSAVINVLNHRFLVTDQDHGYLVQCFVGKAEEDRDLETYLNVSPDLGFSETISLQSVPPTCNYTLRRDSANGPIMQSGLIGQTVFHRWECDGGEQANSVYGMQLHDCFAGNDVDHQYPIIDSKGCTPDAKILSPVTYSEQSLLAYAQSKVFTVADVERLRFQCKVRLCTRDGDGCEGVTPPICEQTLQADLLTRLARDEAMSVQQAFTSEVRTSIEIESATRRFTIASAPQLLSEMAFTTEFFLGLVILTSLLFIAVVILPRLCRRPHRKDDDLMDDVECGSAVSSSSN